MPRKLDFANDVVVLGNCGPDGEATVSLNIRGKSYRLSIQDADKLGLELIRKADGARGLASFWVPPIRKKRA